MTDFGLVMFPADYAIAPSELAVAAEHNGFESLFFPEHTHIPASRLSPWPGGADLPKEYWHTHDPFVGLAAAAAVTTNLKVGTGIALVTERDPILMAKQVATLDHISNGRLILGVGAGWNAEEMENHGTPFASRWKVLRERILAMKAIWTDDAAEFHGDYVDFDPMWSYPKPKQAGGPPILLGAASKYMHKRIAEYCDGWFPIYQDEARAAAAGATDYSESMRLTREAWDSAGRSGSPNSTIFGVGHDPAAVERCLAHGFDRIVFALPPAGADEVLPMIERYATLKKQFD